MRHEASVEELLTEVAALKPERIGEVHELSVPDLLTFRGKRVGHDIAMAIVLDALLAKGLFPAGFGSEPGGRIYRYQFEGLGTGSGSAAS